VRQALNRHLVLSMRSLDKKFWIGIIIAAILAYPTWHYLIKDWLYCPGPVFNTPSDSLQNMLISSGIKEHLKEFRFIIIKPALETQLESGRYTGSRNFRFFKTSMYVKLLEDILSRNNNRVFYHIDRENKIIIISLKNDADNF
jgi:hypothetical protein